MTRDVTALLERFAAELKQSREKIAEAHELIGLALKRLSELNRDDESGIRSVLANARAALERKL